MNEIGLKLGTVALRKHSEKWKELFEKERQILLRTFPDRILEISHAGSTAVPGIPAKPIIDMFAVVESLHIAEDLRKELESLDYHYLGHEGVPERIVYAKGTGEERTHHLQFMERASAQWENHWLIKDYYLKHPDVAEEYARLKESLAKKHPNDRKAYGEGKHEFIQSVIKRARQERP